MRATPALVGVGGVRRREVAAMVSDAPLAEEVSSDTTSRIEVTGVGSRADR